MGTRGRSGRQRRQRPRRPEGVLEAPDGGRVHALRLLLVEQQDERVRRRAQGDQDPRVHNGSCCQSGVGNGGGQDCNELDEHHCIKSSICYYDTDMLSCEPNDEKEGSPTKHSTAGTKDRRMGFNCTTSVNGTNTTTVVSSNTTTT